MRQAPRGVFEFLSTPENTSVDETRFDKETGFNGCLATLYGGAAQGDRRMQGRQICATKDSSGKNRGFCIWFFSPLDK
jgi:hypothetical protein